MEGVPQGSVVNSVLDRLKNLVTAVTVYGEPVEREGVTLVPASLVIAGGGGGGGSDARAGSGEGGGVGIVARPIGAFVIRQDKVVWKPAISPGTVVLIVLLSARVIRRLMR